MRLLKSLTLETGTRLFSGEMGRLENTGVETDVAVLNDAYFYVHRIMGKLLFPDAVTFR